MLTDDDIARLRVVIRDEMEDTLARWGLPRAPARGTGRPTRPKKKPKKKAPATHEDRATIAALPQVSETDMAAARAIARRMGLVVQDPPPKKRR